MGLFNTVKTRGIPGESSRSRLSMKVRSGPCYHPQPSFLCGIEHRLEVMGAGLEIEGIWVWRVESLGMVQSRQDPCTEDIKYPVEINRNGIEASRTDLLEYIKVQRRVGDSPVVEFTRENKYWLAIDMKGGLVPKDFSELIPSRNQDFWRPTIGQHPSSCLI